MSESITTKTVENSSKKKCHCEQSEAIRLHILISGRVQGVGFRFFTRHQASMLGITGYVRNLINGKVEVVAEGKEPDLEEFVKKLREGASLAWVTDIKVNRQKYKGDFKSFSIRY